MEGSKSTSMTSFSEEEARQRRVSETRNKGSQMAKGILGCGKAQKGECVGSKMVISRINSAYSYTYSSRQRGDMRNELEWLPKTISHSRKIHPKRTGFRFGNSVPEYSCCNSNPWDNIESDRNRYRKKEPCLDKRRLDEVCDCSKCSPCFRI